MKKKYFTPDLSKGFPAGKKINYECGLCGESVESLPEHFATCKCENISVDADSARVTVNDNQKIKFFRC